MLEVGSCESFSIAIYAGAIGLADAHWEMVRGKRSVDCETVKTILAEVPIDGLIDDEPAHPAVYSPRRDTLPVPARGPFKVLTSRFAPLPAVAP